MVRVGEGGGGGGEGVRRRGGMDAGWMEVGSGSRVVVGDVLILIYIKCNVMYDFSAI